MNNQHKIILLFLISFGIGSNLDNLPITIVVSFDGFRYDYMNYVDTPNFDYIEKNGVKAKSLKPIFPSFTFPNHYSIVTGSYSDKHMIIGNTFYDVKRKEYYSYRDSSTVRDGSWYGAEPIWVTAQKNNLKSATYFWIGSEAEIQGIRPNIYKNFIPMVDPIKKVDEVIEWINLPKNNRPNLILLYFDEPDHSAHLYGSLEERTLQVVEKMDKVLGYLLDSINELGLKDSINLIIVSDHGMSDVNKIINIDKYLDDNYDVYGKGPLISLRVKKEVKNVSLNIDIPNVTIYKKNNIPERFHYNNHNVPDYLLLADKNYLMYTKEDLKNNLSIIGMHGYDPDILDMHGIFYAYGPNFKENYKIDTFELIHIYPMLCKILDITPNSNCDGKIIVLENILR